MKIIVEARNTPNIWRLPGSTATLEIYANQRFETSDGQSVLPGNYRDKNFYLSQACTIDEDNTLLIPAIEIDSTTDAFVPSQRNVTYTAILRSARGKVVVYLDRFVVPATVDADGNPAGTTWGTLVLYRNARSVIRDNLTFTRQEIIQIVDERAGQLLKASDTQRGITFLDVAPEDPVNPVAVGVNSPLLNGGGGGGSGFYFLANYDSLEDAVNEIDEADATLLIEEEATVTSNLTIPENITLFFTNAGSIRPDDGITVTIQGPITAPPVKIFFNATNSQGTVVCDNLKHQPEYFAVWWGVVGTIASTQATGTSGQNTVVVADASSFDVSQRVLVRGAGQALIPIDGSWTSSSGEITVTNDVLGTNSVRLNGTTLYTAPNEMASIPVTLDLTNYRELRFKILWSPTTVDPLDNYYIAAFHLILILKDSGGTTLSESALPFYVNGANAGYSTEFRGIPFNKSVDLSAVRFLALKFSPNINNGVGTTGLAFAMTLSEINCVADLSTEITDIDGTTLTLTDNLLASVAPDALSQPQTGLNGVLHDDVWALQAALDNVPDNARLNLQDLQIPLTNTWLFYQRHGIHFYGSGQRFANAAFYWFGDSGGVMTYFNRSQDLLGQSVGWYTATSGTAQARCALKEDMGVTGTQIQTDCTIEYFFMQNHSENAPDLRMIEISTISPANCEFNKFRYGKLIGQLSQPTLGVTTAVGAYIGASYNAKSEIFDHCSFEQFDIAIESIVGSFVSNKCTGTFCNTCFRIFNATEPINITDANFEASRIVMISEATDAPVNMIRGRFTGNAANSGQAIFQLGNGSNTNVISCVADGHGVGAKLFGMFSAGNARLFSQGNVWDFTFDEAQLKDFFDAVCFNDQFRSGAGAFTVPMVFSGKPNDGTTPLAPIVCLNTSGVQKHLISGGSDGRSGTVVDKVRIDASGMGSLMGGYVEVNGAVRVKQASITSTQTITAGVAAGQVFWVDATSGNIDITVPAAALFQNGVYAAVGPTFTFKRLDNTGNTVRLIIPNGGSLDGSASPATVIATQYSKISVAPNAVSGNNYYIVG